MKGVKVKFVEIPSGLNFTDQTRFVNIWINDMQRNGIVVLSTNPHMREELDGSLSSGFLIEYRDELEEGMAESEEVALDDSQQ